MVLSKANDSESKCKVRPRFSSPANNTEDVSSPFSLRAMSTQGSRAGPEALGELISCSAQLKEILFKLSCWNRMCLHLCDCAELAQEIRSPDSSFLAVSGGGLWLGVWLVAHSCVCHTGTTLIGDIGRHNETFNGVF